MGHDSDGYPKYEQVDVFLRDRTLHQTCRIQAVADRSGNLLSTRSEGNSCAELLRVPTTY